MSRLVFDFDLDSARVSKDTFDKASASLVPEVIAVKNMLNAGYATDYASINVPADKKNLSIVQSMISEKMQLHISALVVVGIGGSHLGALAVHNAINGVLYNERDSKIKVYFADTVDADYLSEIIKITEHMLAKGENVLVNVVTKSGKTTETIANFEIFLELLIKYKKNKYKDFLVVTTDEGSDLWHYALKHNLSLLGVPKKVGGRFSVLSPVGLFPLGILGIDLQGFTSGASEMVSICTSDNIAKNSAALSASCLYCHYKSGIKIHDTFIFSRALSALGLWYRQLIGESIGKKYDRAGNLVEVGITPTVSVGTTDLHSVAQLYLGGPRARFTTFVTVNSANDVLLPTFGEFEALVENIQGKSLSSIMNAIAMGTKAAYKKEERPFVSIHLPQINAFTIGSFLQLKMFEIIYLGYLLHVNPFDQPQVELYKKETRSVLKNG